MTNCVPSMIEVELKFPCADHESMHRMLVDLGAIRGPDETHQDLYFRHPCRDFVQTREALRIRRVKIETTGTADGGPAEFESRVTYKGPHLPGGVKAREELEWCISPSDARGEYQERLLVLLGFEPVAIVTKERRSFGIVYQGREVTVTLDEVEGVGKYVEVEIVAEGLDDMPNARQVVTRLTMELGLSEPESRSYLSMLLANREGAA